MRRLGERLGIRAPSLYKHVSGKSELEDALLACGLEELGACIVAAADGPGDALAAAVEAYRRYALAHPHLYRLLTERPLPDGHRPGPREAQAIQIVAEAAGGGDEARAAWAFAHGMVHLELAQRFPPGADLDGAWRAGVKAFGQPCRAVTR
jgi:AcrR family transcriptional regulator